MVPPFYCPPRHSAPLGPFLCFSLHFVQFNHQNVHENRGPTNASVLCTHDDARTVIPLRSIPVPPTRPTDDQLQFVSVKPCVICVFRVPVGSHPPTKMLDHEVARETSWLGIFVGWRPPTGTRVLTGATGLHGYENMVAFEGVTTCCRSR